MSDPEGWPDWKLLLAKLAILWCLFWGLIGLIAMLVGVIVGASS